MSSSLLIILLVIVWLFVLAPMIIRSRNPIRRTGDALAQTRTLYSGGSGRLVPKARRTAGEQPAVDTDESLFGLPTGVGSTDAELLDVEEWELTLEQTLRREAAGRRGDAVRRAMETRRDSAVTTSPVATPGGGADDETTEIPAVPAVDAPEGVVHSAGKGRGSRVVAASVDAPETEEATGVRDSTVVVDGEVLDRPEVSVDAAAIDAEAVIAHRERRRPRPEPIELTEADMDFAERRRGRGGYDPVADRAAAEDRFRRRRRTAGGLALVALVSVLAALFTVPALWWVAGAAVLTLVGYMTFLRRQVRLEESLHRRRVERMRRARLGVESRDDDELSVVPPRLRRPGAVVLEVDDEDPAFDHLDTHHLDARPEVGHPAASRPRRDDEDHHLRRAVG